MEERILKCFENALETPVSHLEPETRLQEDLEMDSLKLVLLQIALEEEFRFTFDPVKDDFSSIFSTVKSLCDYIEEKNA